MGQLLSVILSESMEKVFEEVVNGVQRGVWSIFDWPVALYQFIAVLLLAVIVKHFFLGKITKFLDDQRLDQIEKRLETTRLNQEAKLKLDSVNKQYESMQKETEELRQQLVKDANLQKDKILQEAQDKAKRVMESLDLQITQEVNQQEEKIKQAIRDIAYQAAEKILKRELDRSKYDDMINDITEEIYNKNKES